MESKELEGIIQKVFSAGVGFERGQSMMEKGHLKMSPKDAVKNILAWHTAEVERAVQEFAADIQRKVDLEYQAGGRYPGHIIEPWSDVVRPIINKAARQPEPKKGQV